MVKSDDNAVGLTTKNKKVSFKQNIEEVREENDLGLTKEWASEAKVAINATRYFLINHAQELKK